MQKPGPPPGLVPVIAQDSATGAVLMLAWADREALARTLATGQAWYYSRSRRELWRKGATSGHNQQLVAAYADCDRDAVLLKVEQNGPACHTGHPTCFFTPLDGEEIGRLEYRALETGFLAGLDALIARRDHERPAGSYVASLLSDATGLRALQKVGEEAVEFALAGAAADRGSIVAEAADLIFHLLVALRATGVTLAEVVSELQSRHDARNEAAGRVETSPQGQT